MLKKSLYIKKIIFFLIFFLSFSNSLLYSENIEINDIKIIGNKTISKDTILSIANIKNSNFKIQLDSLNSMQKKLFESNFFSEISLKTSNNILIIEVIENPVVDYLIIEGLDTKPELKKKIEDSILLKSDVVFSETALKNDINFINKYLSSVGYFNNKIDYEVKRLEQNRVNIFLNIQLNNEFAIKKIFFIGDKKFSSSTLQNIITSREDNILSFLNNNSIPSEDRLNYDVSLLKNFYLSEGYYDIQIANASIEIVDNKFSNIIFSINTGKKYILTNYVFENNLSFLKEDQLSYVNSAIQKIIGLHYNNREINILKQTLSNYLESKNIFANINFYFKKVSEDKLNIIFNISEILNKRIISNIAVTGNDITEERIIRNNLFFTEGDYLLESKLEKSRDMLLSLNIFKDVKINFVTDSNNLAQVNINIAEKPTGEISSGLAVGSAGSVISFNIKENNFLGKAIYLDSGLSIGTEQVLGNITFTNPDFANTGNTVSNDFFVTKYYYNNAGYQNKIIGDTFSIKYEVFSDLSFEYGLNVNYDSIDASAGASSLISSQDGNYLTTKYFYNFINDKRNKKFEPTSGYTLVFGQGLALPPSDIITFSNTLSGSVYKELFSNDYIGSIKYKIRTVNSLNNNAIKLSDRLFASPSDIRGFEPRSIGPIVNGDFIGGNYSYNSTFATTFPNGLPDTWKAKTNLFFDVANVWGSDIDGIADSNKIRSSLGIGLNWLSPIGPISFAYAEPISNVDTDKIQKFSFKLGGAF